MANEIRGRLFETITYIAIEEACRIAGITDSVFHNEKPQGMSIDPDLTIGTDKNHPKYIFMVTASGSSSDSHKKFGRNLAELYEAKSQLSYAPIIVNVYYLSVMKTELESLTDTIYDAVFHINKRSYFPPINRWVQANLKSSAKTKDTRRQFLLTEIHSDPQLALAIGELAKDFASILNNQKKELAPLWSLMQNDYQRNRQKASLQPRTTSVRRGLGKLLVFPDAVRQIIYSDFAKATGMDASTLPIYAEELGFVTRIVSAPTYPRVRLSDTDIQNAIVLLGPAGCEAVLKMAPTSTSAWITPLRNLSRIATHVSFVEQHYAEVTDSVKLKALLEQCYIDPAGLSGDRSDNKVWLLEILISLLKAKSGKKQGYGIASLAEDTGISESGSGAPLLRFIMPKFVQRQELPDTAVLQSLADGLSMRFRTEVDSNEIKALRNSIVRIVIKENLEDRLIPYRNFEPLLWLLEAELQKQGKAYTAKANYIGWINEFTSAGRSSATTPFVKVGTTLIHWKTATKEGRDHKTKELSARARNIRYQWDATTRAFQRRTGVERLVLIIDGDWTEKNLRTLTDAGWDDLVYPDKIAELVQRL